MCGTVSAIGLEDHERKWWPYVRERLRVPGRLMALMRGVLGDTEVAVVVAVTPHGMVTPVAILALPQVIAQEIRLSPDEASHGPLRAATVGDYEVQVLTSIGSAGETVPLAILTTPWIEQHLLLYARTLWRR